MLVFWKESLALLSVPKTGTTALESVLAPRADLIIRNPPILKHTPLYRYRRFIAPYLALGEAEGPFETVAVVRHPVDWLGSWFRYRRREDLAGHANSTAEIDFDRFVREYCKGSPAPYAAVGSQAKFLHDSKDGSGVTHLFRYEEQDRLLAFLGDRLGMPLNLPRMNVSPRVDVTLSPRVEAKLLRDRAEEFALWESAGRG